MIFRSPEGAPKRVLILIENLPLQRDARVRRQCLSLLESGYRVSVICRDGGEPLGPELSPVDLHTYPPPPEPHTRLGFLWEYAYSLLATAILMVKLSLRGGFDAIQACNPPDLYVILAAPFKLFGKPFVFDHHDLSPELFIARYGRDSGLLLTLLLRLERATFRAADHVISTNASMRAIALGRGGREPDEVTIVRNGPDLGSSWGSASRTDVEAGKQFLACWLGLMGVDDGVDLALRAVSHLVMDIGRTDCHFVFLGDGETRAAAMDLAAELGIGEWVSFPGWVPQDVAHDYLSVADLGLSPDVKNLRTDKATSIKVMEYMMHQLPIVAFDLTETQASAGPAAVYARDNDVRRFASLIDELLADPARRAEMGAAGRARIEEGLAWDHQKPAYVGVFDSLLGVGRETR